MSIRGRKILVFTILLLAMGTYMGWSFYISEPTYINNCDNKELAVGDYVAMTYGEFGDHELRAGMVVQTDKAQAIVISKSWHDELYYLNKSERSTYKIIGKGTIYHKVNQWVGFNIMVTTQIIIGIIFGLIMITLTTILWDILNGK